MRGRAAFSEPGDQHSLAQIPVHGVDDARDGRVREERGVDELIDARLRYAPVVVLFQKLQRAHPIRSFLSG